MEVVAEPRWCERWRAVAGAVSEWRISASSGCGAPQLS
jgi:hypothetical protein